MARRPIVLATLLGSCVSVCLFNRESGHAAMNHFLLPEASETPGKERGHYGDQSTEAILSLMRKLDPETGHLTARIYGGAAVVGHLATGAGIGCRNVDVAEQVLKRWGIRVVENESGGTSGRRIYFDTGRNRVVVKTIQKSEVTRDLERKRADIAGRDTRVLVVDDSALVRKILVSAIQETPGLSVCGEAADAYEARDLILSTDPDVICLDIIMPKLDGLQFLKKLTMHFPKPVVICSTIAKAGSDVAARALEYGAVAVVDKDRLEIYRGLDVVRAELIPKLRQAAGRVVRRQVFAGGAGGTG